MDDLEAPIFDETTRFAALREESLELLTAAKSLVSEMRTALEKCKRHRPVVETPPAAVGDMPARLPVRTHRGGRITKQRRQRRFGRPK
jgi:hypothetical protein